MRLAGEQADKLGCGVCAVRYWRERGVGAEFGGSLGAKGLSVKNVFGSFSSTVFKSTATLVRKTVEANRLFESRRKQNILSHSR